MKLLLAVTLSVLAAMGVAHAVGVQGNSAALGTRAVTPSTAPRAMLYEQVDNDSELAPSLLNGTIAGGPPTDPVFCSGFEDDEDGSCDSGTVPGPWSAVTPGPAARTRSGSASDGTSIYVFGGADGTDAPLTDTWKWDAATGNWTQLANMPTGTRHIQGSYLDGKIYVPGAFGAQGYVDENAIYDISTDTWTTGAPTPVIYFDAATAAYAGRIHVFAIGAGGSNNTRHDIYSPLTDTWTRRADFPVQIGNGRAITVGDYIYYIGGLLDGVTTAAVWRYDPASESYTAMASLQTPRIFAEVMADGERIFAVNGGDATYWSGVPLAETVEIYDIPSNTWSYGEPTLVTSAGVAGGKAGGKLMVMGGNDNSNLFNWVQVSTLVSE
jgi:N-acetylneuraminic acid mutarotase